MRWSPQWAVLLLLLAAPLAAEEAPRIESDARGHLVLLQLPPILADDLVAEHLTSGLTTTITILPKRKLGGGAWVEIRYDLWDEVYHLASVQADGTVERTTAASAEELHTWWGSLRLLILAESKLGNRRPSHLAIEAKVLPFSQSEQADTQRWFSESMDRARRSGTSEVGEAAEESSETLSRTFDLLLATSIKRRALISFPWKVALPPSGAQPSEPAGGSS